LREGRVDLQVEPWSQNTSGFRGLFATTRAFLISLLLSGSLACPVQVLANGGPYYFDRILGKATGSWMGYRVLVLDITSFSVDVLEIGHKNVYELTYLWDEAIERNLKVATFIPVEQPGLFGIRDLGSLKRIKPDEVGLPDATMERFLWFKEDELNSGAVLVFVPLGEKTAPIGKPVIMGLDQSHAHFDFLKESHPDQSGYFHMDRTDIRFRFAVDREPDGMPDLAVFDADEGYTRTYLLGRDGGKWIVIWVGFPL
jgi:hypothetical protein